MWMIYVFDKRIKKILLLTLFLLCSNFVNSSVFYCNDQIYTIETPSLYFSDESRGEFDTTELVYIDKEHACEPSEYHKVKSLDKTKSIVTYESPSCSIYTQAIYAYNLSLASNVLFIVEQGREGYRSRIKGDTLPIMALEVGKDEFNLLGCKYQASSLLPGINRWDNLRNSLIFSIFQYLLTAISISLIIFSSYLLYFAHFKLRNTKKVLYILLIMGILDSTCRMIYSLDILNSKGLYPLIISNLFSLGIIFSPIIMSYLHMNYINSILFISKSQIKPVNRDPLLKKRGDVILFIAVSIVYTGIIGFSITTAIKMDGFSHSFYKIQIMLSSCLYIVLSLIKLAVIVYYILSKHFQTHYSKLSNEESTNRSNINITESLKSIGLSSKYLIGSTVLMVLTESITAIMMIVSTRLNAWSFFVRILLSFGVCYGLSIVQFSILLTAYIASLRMLKHMNYKEEENDNHIEMDHIESKDESKTPLNNNSKQIKDYDKIDILLKKKKIESMTTMKMDIEKKLLKYKNNLTKKKLMKKDSNDFKLLKSETAFSDKIVLDDDVNIFVGKV